LVAIGCLVSGNAGGSGRSLEVGPRAVCCNNLTQYINS
jgi:hypothetical protein